MRRDIQTRADIDKLLAEFYTIVPIDGQIGHHFAGVDLVSHIPVIADFWEKALFGNQVYFGNPLTVHEMLHKKSPLKLEHFARWVEIFGQTVDSLFEGEIADNAKLRAKMIGDSLNQRLNEDVQMRRDV